MKCAGVDAKVSATPLPLQDRVVIRTAGLSDKMGALVS